jgi:hypothetical protein
MRALARPGGWCGVDRLSAGGGASRVRRRGVSGGRWCPETPARPGAAGPRRARQGWFSASRFPSRSTMSNVAAHNIFHNGAGGNSPKVAFGGKWENPSSGSAGRSSPAPRGAISLRSWNFWIFPAAMRAQGRAAPPGVRVSSASTRPWRPGRAQPRRTCVPAAAGRAPRRARPRRASGSSGLGYRSAERDPPRQLPPNLAHDRTRDGGTRAAESLQSGQIRAGEVGCVQGVVQQRGRRRGLGDAVLGESRRIPQVRRHVRGTDLHWNARPAEETGEVRVSKPGGPRCRR